MTFEDPHSAAHDHAHGETPEGQQGWEPPAPVADASARTARVTDAPAVGRVQAVVWRAAYAHVLPPEALDQFQDRDFAQAWRAALENPPTHRHGLLVACAQDQVIGLAAIGPCADPDLQGDAGATTAVGELLALGVDPRARRAGHGSRLLNAAVDTLRVKGFERLVAWLLTSDEDTRAFLAAAGMSADGAFRDRVIDPEGGTVREVRLAADLGE